MLGSFAAGKLIANRGDLKRRAVNFKRGQELRLTPELRIKIEQIINGSQAAFEASAIGVVRNLREAWASAGFNHVGRARYYEWMRDMALDLKGQGALFGYPLITNYADALKLMVADLEEPSPRLHKIIGLNIDAIASVLGWRILGPGGDAERRVAEALRDAYLHFRVNGTAKLGDAALARKVAKAVRKLDATETVPQPLAGTARVWPMGEQPEKR